MFKFSFGDQEPENSAQTQSEAVSSLLPAEVLPINILATRSPRISYSKDGLGLPKRDLFDVRFELMGSDDLSEEEKLLLGTEDVRKNVYEGGLKIWEGAYDLLEFLKSNQILAQNVMELGCGAAVPISYLFYQLVKSGKPGRFVLADYNPAVLSRLTMPNIVLSWLAATDSPLVAEDHAEVVLEKSILDAMAEDLQARGIQVEFISGAWSTEFSNLAGTDFDLVLASETIYSLDSVPAFTDVLQRALDKGYALVAAKKIYFGVGGDIIEFEKCLDERKMRYNTVLEKGSVGRVVLEVKHNETK